MSGIDDVGRREGDRLRGEAAAVADTEEQLAALRSTMVSAEPGDTHRRAILGVAAAFIVVVGIGAIAWEGSRDGSRVPSASSTGLPSDAPPTATADTPTVTTAAVPPTDTDTSPDETDPPPTIDAQPSTSATSPTTPESSTPVDTSDPAQETTASAEVIRPVVEPSVCVSVSASQYDTPTEAPPPPLHVFGRRAASPVPIQVFADPELGPTGPFVAILRYIEPPSPTPGPGTQWETVDIDGAAAVLDAAPDGRLDMMWDLSDGSQVVLRSTGVDEAVLVEFVRSLVPRDPAASVPGFDTSSEALALAAEAMNDDVRGGHSYSECRLTDEQGYYVAGSVRGDLVFQYLALVDRADIPDDVERRGDGIVYVTSRGAPALDASVVLEADPGDWLALRARPHFGWPEEPQDRTLFVDQWEYVELRPVDGASTTSPSPLGLRIRVDEGVAFLEIDYSAVVVDDRSEYKSIELTPGAGGMSTARGGTVGGHRIGPYNGGSFTVSVDVTYTNSAGEHIQTTGTLDLYLQG